MKFTRKQFLTTLATGLAGTALRPGALQAAITPKTSVNKFTNLVGTSFLVQPPGREAITLTLVGIEDQKPSNGTTQFSLQFVASSGENLPSGTFDIAHSTLGDLQMFLVPVGADAKGQTRFRADFNLIDQAPQKRR